MFLEQTRRTVRAEVATILAALTEYDQIVFKEVDVRPEEAFQIVPDGDTFVVAFNDPSFEPEELERDCGY